MGRFKQALHPYDHLTDPTHRRIQRFELLALCSHADRPAIPNGVVFSEECHRIEAELVFDAISEQQPFQILPHVAFLAQDPSGVFSVDDQRVKTLNRVSQALLVLLFILFLERAKQLVPYNKHASLVAVARRPVVHPMVRWRVKHILQWSHLPQQWRVDLILLQEVQLAMNKDLRGCEEESEPC